MKFIPHLSPNFGERRGRKAPDLVVLHYTAMKTPEEALERLSSPEFEVSAHYLIAENGSIFSLVDEKERAWHAGVGAWGGVTDVNSASIGIELCNPGNAPFAAPLMDSLEELLADILDRRAISPECVIAHSDCAPGRKFDPGTHFDWQRLARSNLSIWPSMPFIEPCESTFENHLRSFGYTAEVPFCDLLHTFRLRFRPGAEGPLDGYDAGLAADLAKRWPVDRQRTTA